jgi:hypothetical protein
VTFANAAHTFGVKSAGRFGALGQPPGWSENMIYCALQNHKSEEVLEVAKTGDDRAPFSDRI